MRDITMERVNETRAQILETIKNPVLNYKYYRIISGLHIDFYVETW